MEESANMSFEKNMAFSTLKKQISKDFPKLRAFVNKNDNLALFVGETKIIQIDDSVCKIRTPPVDPGKS